MGIIVTKTNVAWTNFTLILFSVKIGPPNVSLYFGLNVSDINPLASVAGWLGGWYFKVEAGLPLEGGFLDY